MSTRSHTRRRTALQKKALTLDELTIARRDTHTVRHVLSRWVRRLERAFQSVPVRLLAEHDRQLYVDAVTAWRQLSARDRGRAAQILRLPTHSVLIECALRHQGPNGDHAALSAWVRELSALVLLELAAQGALPAGGIHWIAPYPAALRDLRSIRLNLLLPLGAGVTALHFEPGAVQIETADSQERVALLPDADLPAGASRPYHEIVPGVYLACSDNNPLSDFEAHPDKQGNTLSLGDKTAAEWTKSLQRCWAMMARYLPHFAEELRLVATLIVPVGFEPERHLSASYQEYIGAIYMTLHPNDMTMVEAVIHEFQHNKINAAFNLDPLLHNAFAPLFSSPVRPDPRPLHGVILAVHAFQPVALLYERMRDDAHAWSTQPSWTRRFDVIVGKIRDGAETVLTHAEPTDAGRLFFAEMQLWDSHFAEHTSSATNP
ncbi:MAG: hypothetical protein KC502_01980 [Myxococcales bacterium]|nr:hypothetical protein [Myxococcales bacterium]